MKKQSLAGFAVIVGIGLILGAGTAFAQKVTAEALFREGLVKERAEGKLREAIFRYERVMAEFPKERKIAAQAMYQLTLAYEKLGDPRVKLLLTRLSRDYAGVEPYAGRARARLAQLTTTSQALFPEVAVDKSHELGSPDGRFVIYHKDLKAPGDDWGRLYLKELATGNERLLLDHPGKSVSNFAWSPDSRQLAFNLIDNEAKINDIRVVQVATGEIVSLGVRGYPIACTDAGEIFFYIPNYSAGGIDYSLVPASGGAARKIFFSSTNDGCCPIITPDATRLITPRSKKLFLVDLTSKEERPVTNGAGEETRAQLSPDGRLLAFAANYDGNWAFYVAPLDQGRPVKNPLRIARVAEPGEGFGWIGRQWWTRDGQLTFGIEHSESNIYRVDVDPLTGRAIDSPRRLTQDNPDNILPAVAPDGKHIAYMFRNGTRSGIAVMDESGLNERPLFEQSVVLDLSWRSPEEILFYLGKPKPGERSSIQSLNINTGVLERVAEVEGLYWRYVPGRNEILHLYPGGGGPRQGAVLKAFSLKEGKDRIVTTIDYLGHKLIISPDSRRIAYFTGRPIQGSNKWMYALSLMSIQGEPEGNLIPEQQEAAVPVSWSPDGKYILYMSTNGPRILNVQTRESWPLHEELAKPNWRSGSWSPTGNFIVVDDFARRSDRIAWQGVTTEAVSRLMNPK